MFYSFVIFEHAMFLLFFPAGTSSIDTTCTIWGLETGQVLGRVNLVSGHVKTQLIAHDKEVRVLLQAVYPECAQYSV